MKRVAKMGLRISAVVVAMAFLLAYVAYSMGFIDPFYLDPSAQIYRPLPADYSKRNGVFAAIWKHDERNVGHVVNSIDREKLEPYLSPYGRETVRIPEGKDTGFDEL